jgi:hypothetical protein
MSRIHFYCFEKMQMKVRILKPHCIQSSRVLVPAGTSKSMLRRRGIQAVTMAYIADAVILSSTMRTGGFELGSSALMSSILKWLHRIKEMHLKLCSLGVHKNGCQLA